MTDDIQPVRGSTKRRPSTGKAVYVRLDTETLEALHKLRRAAPWEVNVQQIIRESIQHEAARLDQASGGEEAERGH